MKGMFFVTVGFHEVYGLSANISAINSEFTLGDIERQRRETIMRLEQEGVIDMNKSLQLPTVLKHIAIISAETAAGYGDFCKQIENNVYGFNLSLKLYPAQMQGIGADNSIMEALDRIINEPKHPDAVVIIRGGGSRSDLACFDSYELAFYVANYPLPILTGIGHERDNSVVDIVAHTRLKTPTAVAEFIIGHNVEFLNLLDTLSEKIITLARSFYELRNTKVEALFLSLRTSVNSIMHSYSERLTQMTNTIALTSNNVVSQRLMQLDSIEQIIKAHDPRDLLKKGYSLTMINGKTLRSAKEVNAGDKIQTLLSDGVVSSIVE
jgi:exodeoxyribonuclease VII large subunit